MRKVCFEITEEMKGWTVGKALRVCGVSLGRVRSLKRVDGGITLDGEPVYTNRTVRPGQTLAIAMPEDERVAQPVGEEVPVRYQDDAIMVLDKPPFMTVHPVKQYRTDTLANAFACTLARQGRSAAFRPINRLDRNTSGLVLAALDPFAAAKLTGKVEKEYWAILRGRLTGKGCVNAPLRRREGFGISREVGPGGQPAVTHWESLAVSGTHSLIRLRLETGRTHQIRAHMSYLGFPLEGDTMYGQGEQLLARQALHCHRMWLNHPITGEPLEIESPLPEDLFAFAKEQNLL